MTHLYIDNHVRIEQANGVTRVTLLHPLDIDGCDKNAVADRAADLVRWAVLDCFEI